MGRAVLTKVTARAVKSAALCTFAISFPQLAFADTTIINGPVTTTQGPTNPPLNGSDTLVITNTGSISTDGVGAKGVSSAGNFNTIINSGSISILGSSSAPLYTDGIDFSGNSNKIINSGLISTYGEGAAGVFASGSLNTITNSGSISTLGASSPLGDAYGIGMVGNSNAINNSGSIATSGSKSYGIFVTDFANTINNSGLITTGGVGASGIYASGGSNTIINSGSIRVFGSSSAPLYTDGIDLIGNSNKIINSGSISTYGEGAAGIFASGSLNTITNSGSISTLGSSSAFGLAYGIGISGDSNAITNSGSITTSGSNSYGIGVTGNSNTITNSGSILSRSSYAIHFNGLGNSLSILNNFIGGGIFMGAGGTVNLTTGPNYSKLYTFEGTGLAISGSGPVPLFVNLSTQQAATYDPTIFASSSDALADMTNTISSLIPGRFNGTDNNHPFWAKGFGMAASYEATNATLDRSYNFSGVAMGYDAMRTKDLTFGVLGGYGQTSLSAEGSTAQSFNTSSDDGFVGVYGQKRWKNLAVDFAIYGGLQSFQQQRYVNDNLAYLGGSSANASYQGWWISPEVGITYNAGEINGWSFLPTARLRYAQQWMGGYAETGGAYANANVNGRSVAIGQSFVGIGTKRNFQTHMGKDTKMVLDGQVGYIYRGVVGDDTVGVTMIGQSLSLPAETSSRNAVALSAGVTIDLSSSVALKIRGDFAAGGGMQYASGGWAGLSVKF